MRSLRVLVFLLSAITCLGQTPDPSTSLSNSQMPSVIVVPPEAQPSNHFSADAATRSLSRRDPRRRTRPLRCLLRRRILAHSLGFPLWRGRRSAAAQSSLVRENA